MIFKNVAKYFCVGGICFAVDFSVFYVLTIIIEYNYLIANIFSFSIATVINYLLCIKFVFVSGAKYNKKAELFMVFCVSCATLSLNQLLLYIFAELFSLDVLLSKATAVALTFLLNYFGRSLFVFSGNKK